MSALAVVGQNKPKFTNASKILATIKDDYDKSHLQFVRVLDKTANITNGNMLLRRYVDAPNGLYNIEIDGCLSPTTPKFSPGNAYPDLELMRPPLEKLKPFCNITRAALSQFIMFCQEVRKAWGDVIVDKDSMWMKQNPLTIFRFPFNVPHPIIINPVFLEIAFIEMLQYPEIYLLREIDTDLGVDQVTPVVFGVDWGSCALIMPIRRPQDG